MGKLAKICAVFIPIGIAATIAGSVIMSVSEEPDFDTDNYSPDPTVTYETTELYEYDEVVFSNSNSFGRDEADSIFIDCTAATISFYKNSAGYTIDTNGMRTDRFWMECSDDTINIKYDQKDISDFDSGSLDISIPDTCKRITIRCNAGDISIHDFIGDDIDISLSCGNIDIRDSNILNSCKINNTLGNVEVDDSVISELKADLTSGNIDVSNTSLKGNNNINVDVGNCEVTLNGSESDYSFNVSTKVGEIDCDYDLSSLHQSDDLINISVIAGNCSIDFNN